jgi:protoheme ferro-lyase
MLTLLAETGDPYEFQIRANFEVVREHFMSLNYSNVTIAFQNHGGKGTKFPQSLFEWSSPPDTDVIPQLASQSCSM